MPAAEKTDRELLLEIRELIVGLSGVVDELAGKVQQLEEEFGPLGRRYARVIDAASKLPGVGLGRGRSNGNGRSYTSPGDLGARPR